MPLIDKIYPKEFILYFTLGGINISLLKSCDPKDTLNPRYDASQT
jgi:hypothetical protein